MATRRLRSLLSSSLVAPVLALALAATACSPTSTVATSAPSAPDAGPFVARFDAAAGELPEGLVLSRDSAYVGMAPTSRVVRVSLATGAREDFGSVPAPVAGKGFMTGLAVGPGGDVYVGLTSFVPDVQAGIYKLGTSGGEGALFAKDEKLSFPNALAFDETGALFATDSGSGSVFRIDAQGHAERWVSGDLLVGSTDACGAGLGAGFDIGANGLVVERDAVYVVNNDKATLLAIPRGADGKAGAPRVIAGPDCANLAGADGLARAPDGTFTVALNRQNRIVRVTPAGAIQNLLSGAPLDFPATVAYADRDLYVTSFALANASAGKPASPALLKIRQ